MHIWKIAACTLAAFASGDLGHAAYATLSKNATFAPRNFNPSAEILTNAGCSLTQRQENKETRKNSAWQNCLGGQVGNSENNFDAVNQKHEVKDFDEIVPQQDLKNSETPKQQLISSRVEDLSLKLTPGHTPFPLQDYRSSSLLSSCTSCLRGSLKSVILNPEGTSNTGTEGDFDDQQLNGLDIKTPQVVQQRMMLSNTVRLRNLLLDRSRSGSGRTEAGGVELHIETQSTLSSRASLASYAHPTPLTSPDSPKRIAMLSDIQGNWAQNFIEPLNSRGIIEGFPDGTFRPDEPVTRAQFAAMIEKAFQKKLVRNGVQFVDTPANYWASGAIETAYKMGFLQGYPGNIFYPNQNIPRVQVLVSLVNGLNLSPKTTTPTVLNTYFQDASDIPDYAREKVVVALQNRLVINYPNVQFLNPNQVATRAEVAAFIYQALVKEGIAQELTTTQTATQYIVDYKPRENTAPQTAQLEDLRQRFRLPSISSKQLRVSPGIISTPGSSVASPTAFGAEFGDVFVGGSYQAKTRFTNKDDGGVVFGFGLGEAQIVGLEVAVSSFSTFREGFFSNGGVSFKLHHLFPADGLAIAAGVENAATFGSPDAGSSVYGVVSKIFPLKDDPTKPFSSVTVSLGLGGGRFRSEHDVQKGIESVNVFGSVGLRIFEPISLIADWTGQDLTLGASIAPFRNIPIVITPAVADVTGNAGDGARFILGFGFGYFFK